MALIPQETSECNGNTVFGANDATQQKRPTDAWIVPSRDKNGSYCDPNDSRRSIPMNRFVLDENPQKAAMYHNDKHVVKMCLEEAQMLSTAHHMSFSGITEDFASRIYKATHVNHPCSIWVRQSEQNYLWALSLFESLCAEYTYRYGKVHKSFSLYPLLSQIPSHMPSIGLTPFPQAMPEYCKRQSSVEAYQAYYVLEKADIAKWTKREKPEWYSLSHLEEKKLQATK